MVVRRMYNASSANIFFYVMLPRRFISLCSSVTRCLSTRPNVNEDIIDLSYRVYGKESSQNPLVILHGLFGSKQNWHSLAKRFAQDGRQVITLDSRNHGESPHSSMMNYPIMAADVENILDQLNLNKVVLLGHSMGGKVVMTSALNHPERIEGLIVVDVSPVSSPGQILKSYAEKMHEITLVQNGNLSNARRECDEQLATIVSNPGVRQFLLTNLVEQDGCIQWRLNLDSIVSNFQEILDFPPFSHTFDKETLFVGGANSNHINGQSTKEIHRLFSRCTIEMIQDAGHWVHSEKPREFVEVVQNFLFNTKL